MRQTLWTMLLALAALPAPLAAQGKVFLTTKEALALAFPGCEVARVKHVLDAAKQKRATELAGHKPRRAMVYAYEARKDGALVGTAYFDRHRVRSKQELVMIVVDPRSRVRRLEVVSFGEPLDYLPRGGFYAQLVGRALDADLSTKRGVVGVTGATLTVHATVQAVRRVLAAHMVLHPEQRPRPSEPPVGERRAARAAQR
jgi:hypothetical protein